MRIKAVAQSFFFFSFFFVARQHQGYLFCLVECKVNRSGRTEIGKALAQARGVNERRERQAGGGGAAVAAYGQREKLEVKDR